MRASGSTSSLRFSVCHFDFAVFDSSMRDPGLGGARACAGLESTLLKTYDPYFVQSKIS